MKILISGASGLIGSELAKLLEHGSHEVVLFRRPPKELSGATAVVHLGGTNIAAKKWTPQVKKEIRDSRIDSTKAVVELIAKAEKRPKVFVCASAIGFYGVQREEVLTETSSAGTGFLADVCQAWEAEARKATELGVRVVSLRFGMVLSRRGGALKRMLVPFSLGLGGRLGDGQQHVSWITGTDAARAILYCIEKESLLGPVNAVAPQVATNAAFTEALGRALNRPTFLPMPAFVLRLLLGEMAQELLLSDLAVVPEKLHKSGFVFQYSRLDQALQSIVAGNL